MFPIRHASMSKFLETTRAANLDFRKKNPDRIFFSLLRTSFALYVPYIISLFSVSLISSCRVLKLATLSMAKENNETQNLNTKNFEFTHLFLLENSLDALSENLGNILSRSLQMCIQKSVRLRNQRINDSPLSLIHLLLQARQIFGILLENNFI